MQKQKKSDPQIQSADLELVNSLIFRAQAFDTLLAIARQLGETVEKHTGQPSLTASMRDYPAAPPAPKHHARLTRASAKRIHRKASHARGVK